MAHTYPIGTPGQPWTHTERLQWLNHTKIKRSYSQQVLQKLDALHGQFDAVRYGALPIDSERYPLWAFKTRHWDSTKPIALITGGVHGYETSGVHGAIRFLENKASHYSSKFNIVVAPCVSPWGYETINRWNPNAIDPNRSFYVNSPSEECAYLLQFLSKLEGEILLHVDLHETTDTDEQEFRPALAARDGKDYIPGSVPDGFYLVGDTELPQPEFQRHIIDAVKQVTHIAPADADGNIIGSPVVQHGVINYATKALFLCAGMTNAQYVTTTEVYPDSANATDEQCNAAQVAAVTSALEFVMGQHNL